ncbi:MAG: hypothetical protein HRT89_08085, partial [Lentisphaeria bacterium]|nr:hypothetical protein [Lentisphaeria bacterium]
SSDNLKSLDTSKSRISGSVSRSISRLPMDALVVISDGISTDGPVPDHILNWAVNRGVPIFSYCPVTGTGGNFDVILDKTICKKSNPREISAVIKLKGRESVNLKAILYIDNKKVASQELELKKKQNVSFPLKRQLIGWHDYRVEVEAVSGELTVLNNQQSGIFHVNPPSKILLVYFMPSVELRLLSQYLRGILDERFEIAAADELEDFKVEECGLLIALDLDFKKLPKNYQQAINGKRLNSLLISGRRTKNWEKIAGYPVRRFHGIRNLYKEKRGYARVQTAGAFASSNFKYLKSLFFTHVQRNNSAVELLTLKQSDRFYPFLLADKKEMANYMVLLGNSSWKWGGHPDEKVRKEYHLFWKQIMDWALGESDKKNELLVDYALIKGSTHRFYIDHKNSEKTKKLKDVILTYRESASTEEIELKTTFLDGRWYADYPGNVNISKVVWVKAKAIYDGETKISSKRPYLMRVNNREFLNSFPQVSYMKRLATDDGHFANVETSAQLIKKIAAHFGKAAKSIQVRKRKPTIEYLLTLAIVIMYCLEWFFERRTKESINA